MSVHYSEKEKTFFLRSKDVCYSFRVTENGFLNSLYFGADIPDCSLVHLIKNYDRGFSANFDGAKDRSISLDTMSNEYACYGTGDFREPACQVLLQDGSRLTDFRYAGYEVLSEKPPLEGLPYVKGKETLVIRMEDQISSLQLRLFYTVYEDLPVIIRHAELTNNGKGPVRILRMMSSCFDLPDMNYQMLDLYGKHCGERQIQKTALRHGKQEISSARAASSHQHNPFCALLRENTDEEQGEVYAFNLVYSGSFSISVTADQFETTRVLAGINPFDFSWLLSPGETFTAPETVAVYSDAGLGKMSRTFHDLYRNFLLPEKFAFKQRPILVNNWESTYFDFNSEKLMSLIDSAAQCGIDTFVLDDGWFGKRDDDNSGLGDWYVNTDKLPGGLNTIIEHCHKNNMKFGIWIEPEMISEDSDLYRAHPQWCIRHPDRNPTRSRNQLILDLLNPDAFAYIQSRIYSLLAHHDISYVKWDMNRHMTENYSATLPADRQQEVQHRYILAVYRLCEFLTRSFPDIVFEGCSGGGGRFDPGMLYYFPQYWTSDDSDAADRARIQYGTSLCYPLSSMTGHLTVCPNHQTGRTTPFETRFQIASLCSFGYELDLNKLTAEQKNQISDQISEYRKREPLVQQGDLYRLRDPFESNEFCFQLVDKSKSRSVVVLLNYYAKSNPAVERLHLQGLDPSAVYQIEETNQSMSGTVLMNAGISLPWFWGDYHCFTLTLHKIN